MRNLKHLGTTSALALVLAAQTASADVTAKEVWENWRSYMVDTGYEVTANESTSGDVLTISDINMSIKLAADEGSMSIELDTVSFAENGDGTVSIQIPEVMPVRIGIDPKEDSAVDVQLDYKHTGLNMIASGEADDLTYDLNADQLSMSLVSLDVEGEDVSADDVNFTLALAGVAGSSTIKTDETRTLAQNFTANSMAYDMGFTDPLDGTRATVNGTVNGVVAEGSGKIPLEIDSSNVAAMLVAGFSVNGGFKYQSAQSDFKVDGPEGAFEGTSSSEDGSAQVTMDQSTLVYDVAARNAAVNISGDAIPFGIGLNMEETSLRLSTPISKSEEEQDFGLALTLGNFTMDETLWNLFDPSAILPRDPATVSLDLEGKAKLLVNFLDPEEMAELEQSETVPGELNSLTLKNLLVSVAGSTLTGMGNFVFDNTQSFNGLPKPTGAIDLKLDGGNGLLDKLVQMGLLPEEQAMGARMMMGLFAVPGETPDTLNSKIEINEEGHVLANGQRIQ